VNRRDLLKAAARRARDAAVAAAPDIEAPRPVAERIAEPPLPDLSESELERYGRQLVLPEWSAAAQARLRRASVLVVGAGALGSPVAMYLAGAGVGRIGILDGDDVELSNLHRQLLHLTPDVGTPKAHSAAAKLEFLNPEILVDPYQVTLDDENAAGLIAGHDLVVDCSDTFATRYAVNTACCDARTPLVEGGVSGFSGLVMSILPHETACYRCAFPEPPPPGSVPTCAEAGVLGPAAGVVGSLQALEALKLLSGLEPAVTDAFLQVDLLGPDVTRVAVARRADCPDCGP
jgi:molybdopterin/thiamine biosynthesis adenylyltransferase